MAMVCQEPHPRQPLHVMGVTLPAKVMTLVLCLSPTQRCSCVSLAGVARDGQMLNWWPILFLQSAYACEISHYGMFLAPQYMARQYERSTP
jgi:hypothetical protein